jgi:hypothetical protein
MNEDRRHDGASRERIDEVTRTVEEHVSAIPEWREALQIWQREVEERNVRRVRKLGRRLLIAIVVFGVLMIATGVGFLIVNSKRQTDIQEARFTNLKLGCDDMNDLRVTLTLLADNLGVPRTPVERRLPRIPNCTLYAARALGGDRLAFNDEAAYQQHVLHLHAAPLPPTRKP